MLFPAEALHLLLIFAYYYDNRRLPLLLQRIATRLQIGKDIAFQSLFSVIYGMLTPFARSAQPHSARTDQPTRTAPTSP
jgi:hypothetical protein